MFGLALHQFKRASAKKFLANVCLNWCDANPKHTIRRMPNNTGRLETEICHGFN